MKFRYLILSIAAFVISFCATAQDKKKYKDLFEEAFTFIMEEDFEAALPILLEIKENHKDNPNINSMIGYSYLQQEYGQEKALDYFEPILEDYKNLNTNYRTGNRKEKFAPVETILWAGMAYHYNYKFDEALDQYNEYKGVVGEANKYGQEEVTRHIRITKNAIELRNNPVNLTMRALDVINTKYPEYRPKISGDERIMYFTSRRPSTINVGLTPSGLHYEDIYFSKKIDDTWTEPEPLPEVINSPGHDAIVYISPNEEYMLLYKSDMDLQNEGGIYESYKEGNEWSEPVLLQADINSDAWETDANISSNGQSILFTSDRKNGKGGRDIWMMKKLPNGKWANVQNLGAPINTEYDEEAPYLHPDGKTLYFSSKGHNTMGGYDVFKSDLMEDGTWGTPVNVGYPINTVGNDVFYLPSLDGKKAYFSSFRKKGKGLQDIYEITLPDEPERTIGIYKGIAKYEDGQIIKDVSISIKDEDNKLYGKYSPNHESGKFLFILTPGETFTVNYTVADQVLTDTIKVPSEGGRYDILKIITIKNGDLAITDANADESTGEIVLPEAKDTTTSSNQVSELTDNELENQLNSGQTLVIDMLYFIYDKDKLIAESKPDISKIVNYMKKNPTVKVKLDGHTDGKGAEDYNQKLSEERSARVKNLLIKNGIDKNRIETYGFGKTKPIAPNTNPDGSDNPEGRQKNRRVEITVLK